MPDPSKAARNRRYRARRAGDLPPVERLTCPACSKLHTGARGLLCCRCWERLTPEGKAWRAERVARSRKRKQN